MEKPRKMSLPVPQVQVRRNSKDSLHGEAGLSPNEQADLVDDDDEESSSVPSKSSTLKCHRTNLWNLALRRSQASRERTGPIFLILRLSRSATNP